MKRLFISCLCWVAFQSASAFQFSYMDTLVITEPVNKNLYIAGGHVIINAPIHGDLIVAGATVQVNDSVSHDILVMGGDVLLSGYVGDDVRCVGGKLRVTNRVAGDLVWFGSKIILDKTASVGTLFCKGAEMTINGQILGPVKCSGGTITFNGIAMNDLDCRGAKISINGKVQGPAVLAASDQLLIGPEAGFDFGARYWVPEKGVDFKQSVKTGAAAYDPTLRFNYGRWYFLGSATLVELLLYCGMVILLIALVQWLFGNTMKKAGETVYTSSLKSLGLGLLLAIGVPISIIILAFTVVGLPVAFILLCAYVILVLMATVIVSVVGANWLRNRSQAPRNYWNLVFTAFAIFVVLKIVSLTPVLGWIVSIFLGCVVFGAIALNLNWRTKRA